MTTKDIIPQHGGPATVLSAVRSMAYVPAAGGGWFADLLDRSGRRIECGFGATKDEAAAHLNERLQRSELASMLGALLGEDCSVTFGYDAEDGSYFADVITRAGKQLSGSGDTPAAALRDAGNDADEDDLEPYCKTCGEPVSIFISYTGWQHYRGDGTPENRIELYDAGHAPVVAWRWPGEQ